MLVQTDSPVHPILQPPTPPTHHRFHFLDALRGVASILIVFRHAPIEFAHTLLTRFSYTAVDFFFCLSGFVIAFSYQKRLRTTLTLRDFLAARIIRLYPLAILGTLLGAVAILASQHLPGKHMLMPASTFVLDTCLGLLVLPHLSLVRASIPLFPFDAVMWTLFVEILANLLFAALLRIRLAASAGLSLIATASLAVIVRQRLLLGTLDFGFSTDTFITGFARVGFSFFVGVLIFRLLERRSLPRLRGTPAVLSAAALTVLFLAWLANSRAWAHPAAIELLVVTVFFPILVVLGAQLTLPDRYTQACSLLGSISYPLYLLHKPLLGLLYLNRLIHFATAHPNGATLVLLGYTLILIAASWFAAFAFDEPVRRYLAARYRAHVA